MKLLRKLFLSERNILIAIIINALVLCLLYFPEFEHDPTLIFIDHIFIFFFLLEALVKIRVLGARKYFNSGWNRFDFFIVILSLPSLLMNIFPLPDTSLLMILRLLRLARLVRFIHFIPNLSKVIIGLGRAIKASVFVLGALLFLNFLLAIFTCHFYAKIVPEHFGNPLISSYSIFQMFTVEGWNEIPATIAEKLEANALKEAEEQAGIIIGKTAENIENSKVYKDGLIVAQRKSAILVGLTRFYFVLVVLVGGIFGMSLANAVFVDEMTMDNNDAIEQRIEDLHQEISELKDLLKNK